MPEDGNAAAGISPLAGNPATKDMPIDVGKLERDYFARRPDISGPNQLVSFGASGHRGPPFSATFTEAHILAITQAICDYRRSQAIDGLLWGKTRMPNRLDGLERANLDWFGRKHRRR